MITKSPVDNQNCLERRLYFNSARRAFFHLLRQLHFAVSRKILIPAYIGITDREGSGVFDPIEEAGIRYSFYSLDNRLQAVVDDIKEQINNGDVGALLLIHYFGFPQKEISRLKDICSENNVYLIEDCAHCLYGSYKGEKLGNYGEFSFYSIHKTLPVDNGGFLQINSNYPFSSDVGVEKGGIKQDVLETICSAQGDRIIRKRINNYNYLLELLNGFEGIEIMFPELEEGVVPLNMPVIVSEGKREPLYYYLLEKGIPTIALYYRLIEEISEKDFPTSYYLSKNILNLPTHQDTNYKDLEKIVYNIRNYLS